MRFHLGEEQIALKDSVGRFLGDACKDGLPRRAAEGDPSAEVVLSPALFEMGIGGILIPDAYGGMGLDLVDAALVSECMGYAAVPWPYLAHAVATLAIARGGSEAQKKAWLPRLATGEARATFAFCEDEAGWMPQDWRLPLQDGCISGTKRFVLGAREADIIVAGVAGRRLALVETARIGCEAQRGLDGTRRISTVTFGAATAELLPHVDADAVFDALLVLLSADAYGCARRCIDMTVEYVSMRKQFGRAIGSFQGLKHQLANVTADIVATEAMYWYAAVAEGMGPSARGIAAAQTKAHVTDRAVETARLAVEMHGGIGYTWDYDLHIWLKRAMFDFAFAGTPVVHRGRAMALAETEEARGNTLAELF